MMVSISLNETFATTALWVDIDLTHPLIQKDVYSLSTFWQNLAIRLAKVCQPDEYLHTSFTFVSANLIMSP